MKIRGVFFPRDRLISQIVKNTLSRNVEESVKKILGSKI